MFKAYSMIRKRYIMALVGLVITLVLVACSGGNTAGNSTTPTPVEGSISATGHGALKHMPYGSAELTWNAASKALTVKMSLSGLVPHSIHPAHIHSGTCNIPGRLMYPLQYVVADATGNATVTSTVKGITDGIPATGWLIYVHNGPYVITTAQSLPITCGEITNTAGAKSVVVSMGAAVAEQDQAVSGTVQLTLRGSQLTVNLRLSGLQAGSVHAAQIYAGSCSRQGNVVHQLPNMVADAKGNADMTGVINNVPAIPSSGWYVNVHYSTDLTNQAGADAIVCGDITGN